MENEKIVKKIIKWICIPVKNMMLLFFYFFFKMFCKGEFQGESIIRRNLKTGFIIVANHVSYLDWLVLIPYFTYKYKISVTWFAKKKLYHHPVWAPILHGSDFIQVSDNGERILSFSLQAIKSRSFFGIFPEGTRSYSGNGQKPKTGLIGLMKLTGLPVIPTALIGFYEIWPRNQKIPTPGKGIVRFCNEIRYDDLNLKNKDNEEKQMAMEKIMNCIKKENQKMYV